MGGDRPPLSGAEGGARQSPWPRTREDGDAGVGAGGALRALKLPVSTQGAPSEPGSLGERRCRRDDGRAVVGRARRLGRPLHPAREGQSLPVLVTRRTEYLKSLSLLTPYPQVAVRRN